VGGKFHQWALRGTAKGYLFTSKRKPLIAAIAAFAAIPFFSLGLVIGLAKGNDVTLIE
jgi:hypothetical protein